MLRDIHIYRLRGIREGHVEDLAPLTVLVGPNSCGKSTVLDAIHIGAAPNVIDGVGQAVIRRKGVRIGAPWLLWKRGEEGPAITRAVTASGHARIIWLALTDPTSVIRVQGRLDVISGKSQHLNDLQEPGEPDAHFRGSVHLNPEAYSGDAILQPLNSVSDARLVVPGDLLWRPVHRLYSEAVVSGDRQRLTDLVAAMVPGVRHLEILTDERDNPVLHMVFDTHSVPLALAGDGVVALMRAAFELAIAPGGLVLMEEPEVHQHPRAIAYTAKAIHEAVARGVQVIISTHSLEVIDYLLSEAPKDFNFNRLAVFSLSLQEGSLNSVRIAGPDVLYDRERLGEDLR